MELHFRDDHTDDLVIVFLAYEETVLRPLVKEVPVDVNGIGFREVGGDERQDLREL